MKIKFVFAIVVACVVVLLSFYCAEKWKAQGGTLPTGDERKMSRKEHLTVPDVQPEVIDFYCSDPRLKDAFEEFLDDDLGLKGKHIPMPKFGGPAAFANQSQLFADYSDLKTQIAFAREHWPHSIKRFVLVAHEQCGYYKEKLSQNGQVDLERRDLFKAALYLQKAYPGMEIELYYGRFTNAEKTRMSFEKVERHALQPN